MDSYCVKCSLQFDKRSKFDKHMSFVHQKMSEKEDLIDIEEPEKDTRKQSFRCEICDKGFTQKQSMAKHIVSIHKKM